MRERYMNQLKQLNELLTEMGQMVEKAIEMAIQALVSQNKEQAEKAINYDEEIDDKEKEIQNLCLKLLLCQHIGFRFFFCFSNLGSFFSATYYIF